MAISGLICSFVMMRPLPTPIRVPRVMPRPIASQTLVTIGLAAEGTRSRLTFDQGLFQSVAVRDAHLAGWSLCLDRLTKAAVQP